MTRQKPHIAILGAGPIGLEAALAAADAGFPFTLYEAAETVGGNVRAWGHARLFTPWEMNVSPRMRRHLDGSNGGPGEPGKQFPGDSAGDPPTGHALASLLLEPISRLPAVAPQLRLATTVVSVGRQGLLKNEEISTPERARRPFRLLLSGRPSRPGGGGQGDGVEWTESADIVLDTTGTWGHPNSLGDAGIPAPGERALGSSIRRDLPDFAAEPAAWAGRTVLLAGSGHSAQTAARGLAELAREAPGTRLIWVLRKPEPSWGSPQGDPLPARAALASHAAALAAGAHPAVSVRRGAVVAEISRAGGQFSVTLSGPAGPAALTVDRVLSLTGAVGDHGLYRQLQVHECYATCGPIKLSAALLSAGAAGAAGGAGDCLAQTSHGAETLVNPEPGFFILGSKSYGRNNTFLLRVGWDQVSEVFGLLASL